MTLLSRSINALVKYHAPTGAIDRVPMSMPGFGIWQPGANADYIAQMSAYTAVGWLFAVVSRIASAVAAVEWKLYRQARPERIEIEDHPVLTLWRSANPFYTGHFFVEAFQQLNDLTGEAWLLVLRNRAGMPVELWPIRSDRISPIPHPTEYLTGYVYKIGAQRIQLDVDDIIPILMPNPLNPYRGAGPVQALLPELDADHMSVLWSRNFYSNGARPGGIIEVDQTLDDAGFAKFRARWAAQHGGVSNAHRVAILERAKWVDVSSTQRDMQQEQIRKLTRDNILGAFGVPLSVMGITESVNRANAEAGDVMFARWVLRPRLARIRAALNERLLPMFGEGMEFDFVDPTPDDRVALLNEANVGYTGGILTQNEARRRLGEDAVDEGDDFKAPAPSPFALSARRMLKAAGDDTLLTTPVQRAEASMRAGWTKRLGDEADALAAYMEQFGKSYSKIEVSDLAGYDWDWWAKYGAAVIDELTDVVMKALVMDFPELAAGEVQRIAANYARTRGAALLQVTGDVNVVAATRARVGELVAQTIENGDSLKTLEKNLRADFMFSRDRASMVARTECLPGDVLVDAAMVRAIHRRWYDGPMIEMGTADGSKFAATPNHPMLTNRGWLPAGEITERDYLVGDGRQKNACAARYEDVEDPPTTLREIFDAATAISVRERKLGSRPDFHGDGQESEVDILHPHRLLRIGRFSPIYEPTLHGFLSEADMVRAPVCRSCRRLLAITKQQCLCRGADMDSGLFETESYNSIIYANGLSDAVYGLTGGIATDDRREINVMSISRGATANKQSAGLALIPANAAHFQDAFNPFGVGAHAGGYTVDAKSGLVKLNRVISIRIRPFSGHVYNLTTPYGYFSIGGGYYTGNTATGLGQGGKQAAMAMGRDEKHWRTQGAADPRVDEVCLANEAQGWIAIGDLFQGGVDTVPQHVNCQCKTDYHTKELHEEESMRAAEGRCPRCAKLLVRDVSDATAKCKCGATVKFTAGVPLVIDAHNGVHV